MKLSVVLFALMASPAMAEAFDRPIPQAQSATAEFWYALACLTLVASMAAVQWLVSRR
ncbi:protein NnrT [Shimia sp. R9_1]|uniref:protein NnrT n=1 Tax=Shimia sp. R9_1 TaxID=2821111 RepID=UPI001ADC86F0|nr:protein NnrT [Shimia sp. R9_1]MBO9406524.1 protein NnrT [Shimia sp. R9_1]